MGDASVPTPHPHHPRPYEFDDLSSKNLLVKDTSFLAFYTQKRYTYVQVSSGYIKREVAVWAGCITVFQSGSGKRLQVLTTLFQ